MARVIRQLVARHVLWVDSLHRNTLRLGALANDVLRGDLHVSVRRDVVQHQKVKGRGVAGASPATSGLSAFDRRIFEALRKWRLETAKALGKAPYLIFTDRTLAAIAQRKPETLDDMAAIPGVGRAKLERYADEILEVLEAEL